MVNRLLRILAEFVQGKTQILEGENRKSPEIVHYYNEIVRYWSKLNFIINKTLRSLKLNKQLKAEVVLFTTYRLIFEEAPLQDILMEIGHSKEISFFLNQLEGFSFDIALKEKSDQEILSIMEAMPTFFIERLLPVMSPRFLEETIKAMNDYSSHKTIFLRIDNYSSENSLETLINSIKNDFDKKKITFQQDKDIPFIFHSQLGDKGEIIRSKWYQNKFLIFQDKASALIAQLLKPDKGDFICDLCAAPGMKSSLILPLNNNRLRLICNDFSNSRLEFTKHYFDVQNRTDVFLLNSDGTKFPARSEVKFDKILIDAPCSGSGTFLSNPELKWRQNVSFLNQNVIIQEKLIESGLNLLKSGGILVYSTCSLYPEEGELQINKIYDQIQPLDLPKYFSPSYKINKKSLRGMGRLFPSIHNTHGFFVSKLKKK